MIINNSTGEQIVSEASKRLTVDIDYGIRVYMPIQIIKQFEKILLISSSPLHLL